MTTLPNASRNAAVDAVADLVDAGSLAANGSMVFTTGGGSPTTLLTLPMANPAFGAAVAGVATANAIGSANPVANGTAAEASIQDRDGVTVVDGLSVGTSGTDVIFSNVNWTTAETIGLSSFTLTIPAT